MTVTTRILSSSSADCLVPFARSDPSYRVEPGAGGPAVRPARLGMMLVSLLTAALPVAVSPVVQADRATAPYLLEAIPRDVVAAWAINGDESSTRKGRHPGEASDPGPGIGTLTLITSLADQAERMGLFSQLNDSARGWIDSLLSLPIIFDRPYAVALLGVSASVRADGGHELASLRAAIIIHTGGDNDALVYRIRHLLNTYTNNIDTTLTHRNIGGHEVFSLMDKRLPSWGMISWGPLEDNYVIAIGEGAFESMSSAVAGRANTLAADPWVRSWLTRMAGLPIGTVLYVGFDRLSRGMDSLFAEKVSAVKDAMGLSGVERSVWVFGNRDRDVRVKGVLRRHGRDETVTVAGEEALEPESRFVIPDDASGYAVVDAEPLEILRGACTAYLASRSPHTREDIRSYWRGLEAAAGVSIEQDIVAHLGGPIIIHDFPRHALGLPLAWTVVAPVVGNATALRSHIDRMVEVVGDELARGSLIRLGCDSDGVWYAHWGLVGPALAVTDRWLVLSFSPIAVKENVRNLSLKGVGHPPDAPPKRSAGN